MNSKTPRVFLAMAGAVLLVSTARAGDTVAERPRVHGWRVSDNTLAVDGKRADWDCAGMAFTQGSVGASYASYKLWAAMDALYLYLYGEEAYREGWPDHHHAGQQAARAACGQTIQDDAGDDTVVRQGGRVTVHARRRSLNVPPVGV